MLSLSQVRASLLDQGASERWSVLTGEPLLAVECRDPDAAPLEAADCALLRSRLAELPCVTAAHVAPGRAGAGAALLDRFDVLVSSPDELDALRAAVARAPLAALALVQLLRLGERLPADEALTCESLTYAALQAGPEFRRWLAGRAAPAPGPRAAGPAVRVIRENGCLRLRLDRPDRRNALSAEMRDALCEGLGVALADASLERIELSGSGPDFCSGGDLGEFGTRPDPATAHAVRSTRSPARLLARCGDRAHARVHGNCVGAGVELAAFCHRVTARQDTSFRLPELGMGLIPGAGGTVSLPRRIGRQRTAWLALTGARIDAPTAVRWGLVDATDSGPEAPPSAEVD